MRAIFKSDLDISDAKDITEFCNSADYCAIEQYLGFPEILYKTNVTYFFIRDHNNVIKSYCQINEFLRSAHIWFGPVCDDKDMMIESVKEIAEHYKKRGFWYLGIQPYWKTGYDADYIEYRLNSIFKIDYLYDSENTKSSLEIDLGRSLEEIFSNFSKGHKSSVRKAENLRILVEEPKTADDLSSFIRVYLLMCADRKIRSHSKPEIEFICNYIKEKNLGIVLVAKDPEHNVLGGAIFVYQGISVRYLLSASDPGRRDLPLTHLTIYKAIERARMGNFKYFDFWGYNHFVGSDEQIYMVNRFKKGFGGNFTFFMRKINISLIPAGFQAYIIITKTKRIWASIKKIMRNSRI